MIPKRRMTAKPRTVVMIILLFLFQHLLEYLSESKSELEGDGKRRYVKVQLVPVENVTKWDTNEETTPKLVVVPVSSKEEEKEEEEEEKKKEEGGGCGSDFACTELAGNEGSCRRSCQRRGRSN